MKLQYKCVYYIYPNGDKKVIFKGKVERAEAEYKRLFKMFYELGVSNRIEINKCE